jgi:hypothetical protein
MGALIGAVVIVALAVWLLAGGRSRPAPAPEDDIDAAIDEDLLAEAELGLADDPGARPLTDGFDDDEDDWGPGAG